MLDEWISSPASPPHSHSPDGQISLGSDAVDKSTLIEAIRAKLGDDDSRVIHIRSDKEVPFGDVVAVLDLLAATP